jgi:hypothetical protein
MPDLSPKIPVHTLYSRNTIKSCFWGPSDAEGPQQKARVQIWRAREYRSAWTVWCHCSSIYRHMTQPVWNYIHALDIYYWLRDNLSRTRQPFPPLSRFNFPLLSRSFSTSSFDIGSSFSWTVLFISCTTFVSCPKVHVHILYLGYMLVVFLRTFGRQRPPTVAPRSINLL